MGVAAPPARLLTPAEDGEVGQHGGDHLRLLCALGAPQPPPRLRVTAGAPAGAVHAESKRHSCWERRRDAAGPAGFQNSPPSPCHRDSPQGAANPAFH